MLYGKIGRNYVDMSNSNNVKNIIAENPRVSFNGNSEMNDTDSKKKDN